MCLSALVIVTNHTVIILSPQSVKILRYKLDNGHVSTMLSIVLVYVEANKHFDVCQTYPHSVLKWTFNESNFHIYQQFYEIKQNVLYSYILGSIKKLLIILK